VEHGWVLLADARIRPIKGAEAADGLRALARLQREWIGRTDELLAVGCPDRGPATLAGDLAASLADLELATELAPTRGLDAAERERLRALLPAFADLCREAEDDGAPLTLLHGDCHPGNVGVREDGSVGILDWSDAAVGHPFVDVDVWLSHVADDERGPLRAAYLAEWPEVADGERALLRADVLCAAYQVVTSQRLLRALEEDDWPGFAAGMSFWARRILERYDVLAALGAAFS
jgi:Ser/Thr protein kinase RdoA (MazF antagonist)